MAESGFNLVRFKKDAYVMIEGQPERDEFYIIRSGSARVTGSTLSLTESIMGNHGVLGPGDFFGVIPCMARRSNIESIGTEEDTVVIAVKREQFGLLIQKNASVALKIIRYFSKLLRFYDTFLAKTIAKGAHLDEENPENLYFLGKYFQDHRLAENATYAYLRYLQSYPNGINAMQAKKALTQLNPKNTDFSPAKEGNFYVYEDRKIICLESEKGDYLYVIQEGQVKITKFLSNQEVLLNVLKTGDMFGEMAILENKPRNASAYAEGKVKLMQINRENFNTVVQNYPNIASRIIELLSDRIWIIYRQISNLLLSNPENRFYDALYTQLLRSRIDASRRVSYTFDITSEDLLKFCGIVTEDGWLAYRKLQEKDANLSTSADGKIVYRDINQLEKRSNMIRREKELQKDSLSQPPDYSGTLLQNLSNLPEF